VLVNDSPGFATSRLGVLLGLEAMRMVEEGVASAADIDRPWSSATATPWGRSASPTSSDSTCASTSPATCTRSSAPSTSGRREILERMVAEGRLGRKSGRGFYDWSEEHGSRPASMSAGRHRHITIEPAGEAQRAERGGARRAHRRARRLRDDDAARVVVLTGAGDKAFVAGADIGEFAERTPLEQRAVMEARRVFDEIAAFPKPTIAMHQRLRARRRLRAGHGVRHPHRGTLGAARPAGDPARPDPRRRRHAAPAPARRRYGRALRMILTGEMIDAEEADRIGLVDILVEDASCDAHAELAAAMAAYSPVALRLAKAAVAAAWETPLAAGLAYERELFITAFASDDRGEGVAAFLEKRPPEFRGR
jgi:enoyl-CoA hydratase